jgi:hypothetical protein
MALTNGTAASIETAYRNMFRTGFEQSFQQFDSRLLPYVEIERQSSEFDYYDRVGIAEEMTEDVTRYGDNPVSEIELDRRRIHLRDYELGKPIDEKDLIRVATDPTNAYTQAMQASAYRKMDDIIFDAYFGTAYTGKKGATSLDWVTGGSEDDDLVAVGEYSAGHSNPITTAGKFKLISGDYEGIYVGSEYTSSSTELTAGVGLTLDKLKVVRQTMLRLDAITQDTTLNCFLTAKQFDDLLGIDEVINSDYSVRKNLAEGNVTTFMGYRFIHAERLGTHVSGDGGGTARRVIVCLPRSLKLAIGKSLMADMWRLPDKKNIPYIYFKMSVGASRMWGEVAAEIACTE